MPKNKKQTSKFKKKTAKRQLKKKKTVKPLKKTGKKKMVRRKIKSKSSAVSANKKQSQPVKIKVMPDLIDQEQQILPAKTVAVHQVSEAESVPPIVKTTPLEALNELELYADDDSADFETGFNNNDKTEAIEPEEEKEKAMAELIKSGKEELDEYMAQSKTNAAKNFLVFCAVCACVLVLSFFWFKITIGGKSASTSSVFGNINQSLNKASKQTQSLSDSILLNIEEIKKQFQEIIQLQSKNSLLKDNNNFDLEAFRNFNKILIQEVDKAADELNKNVNSNN